MIYLDNSATTRPFDGVIDVMDRCMREQYFNASAAYKPAVDVDRAMRECRKTIAAQLGIQESGVIFTGGGTESDNLAILGTAAALRQGANFRLQRHRAPGGGGNHPARGADGAHGACAAD